MTAEEMFIKLGFTKKITPNTFIMYGCVNITTPRLIAFDKVSRRIAVKDVLGDKLITKRDISVSELMAIIQQCIELGWLEEETCTNESEYNLVDGFECSNCVIIIENYNEIEIDEDYPEDRCMKEYAPRYCPNCGRKIVD
nr:MAG TPA: Thaumarchaeal output domain 1 [Caudoviricetes sp.]